MPYPPLTPFVERIGLSIFGLSMVGLRLFSVIAQALAHFVSGLMARELGGGRLAQMTAALAIALSPLPLFEGTEFQYTTFDYLWWVLIAYFVIRLLKTEDPRWWLAIGATIGVGFPDEVHDGILSCGNCWRSFADASAAISVEPVVLGRLALGLRDFPAELDVADEAWIYLAAFSATHSCARCGRGTGGWIFERAVFDLHESVCGAVVDCRG